MSAFWDTWNDFWHAVMNTNRDALWTHFRTVFLTLVLTFFDTYFDTCLDNDLENDMNDIWTILGTLFE